MCSGYCLSSAYTVADTLGIGATHGYYPTGRAVTCWLNAKRNGAWLASPILAHGMEFQSREHYGISDTIDEDGTLYASYSLYSPQYPPTWFVPVPPQNGSGITAVPPDINQINITTKPGDAGNWEYTSCVPYMDYSVANEPMWHVGKAYAGYVNHYWQETPLGPSPGWTGQGIIRGPLYPPSIWFNNANVTTYYDAENDLYYLIYTYVIADALVFTNGRVYLDVVLFDRDDPNNPDKLIFRPGADRGLEVAAPTKAHSFYPQVTVDKGQDGSFDIIVAWTEADVATPGSGVDPHYPCDGDVFYRQFTLTYLGR